MIRLDHPGQARPDEPLALRTRDGGLALGHLYLTEDRNLQSDPIIGEIGACIYRYTPDQRVGRSTNLAETTGKLGALKFKSVYHPNIDRDAIVGEPLEVEWETVDEPDHEDDTDKTTGIVPQGARRRL